MVKDKFLKLVRGDFIVLNPFAEDLDEATRHTIRNAFPINTTLEVTTDPAGDPPSITLQSHGPTLTVHHWQVVRVATTEDTDRVLVQWAGLDREVVDNPREFLTTKCKYRWLPTDGKTSVRDRYERWLKDPKDSEGISAKMGMLALLYFRSYVCEKLIQDVATPTINYSTEHRGLQIDNRRVTHAVTDKEEQSYISAAKPLVGNAPGSTQPTSDIDVNTRGDSTEFAVAEFNKRFATEFTTKKFGGFEPGIVFDVNLYGKDFLPSFDNWQGRDEDTPAKLIRPGFDHEFINYDTYELDDADCQLTNAFIKLRRYMPSQGGDEKVWTFFAQWFKQGERIYDQLVAGRSKHLEWVKWIAENYMLEAKVSKESQNGLKAETFLNSPDIDSAILMRVQNRCYERLLKDKVEPERDEFNLMKSFGASSDDLDNHYVKLRSAMSESLYFANEAYVTAGAVIQTVGGKQVKSRGVAPGYTGKPSFHNIAYTAHELMASVVDQLADIHKEGGRHFAHHSQDLAGALLGCGKYVHRLLNAVKHLYVLFDTADVPNAKGAYPHALFTATGKGKALWEKFRRFGFGLEASKKMKFDKAEWDKFKASRGQPAADEESILSLLVNKFSQTDTQVTNLRNDFRAREHSRKELIYKIARRTPFNANLIGTLTGAANFFAFFDRFVVEVLQDYETYRAMSSEQLRKKFAHYPEKGPHFTLADQWTDFDQIAEEAEAEAAEDVYAESEGGGGEGEEI